jgi:Tol biopolymer transport system component
MMGVAWGADDKIYFAGQRSDASGVWRSAVDGSNSEQVVSGESIVTNPSVSPDGRSITYTSLNAGSPSIWRADSDGKNAKALTADGEDYAPSYTPDGKWIIFVSWRSGPLLVYRVPAMGGELVKITDQSFFSPAISPDGKSIAGFYTDSTDSELKIGILDIESGRVIKKLPRPATVETGRLVWTKDGKNLIGVETKSNISNLVSLPIDGGAATQLTRFSSEAIRSFDLSPDGKRFLLSRGPANVDLLLMKNFR